jgi:amidase
VDEIAKLDATGQAGLVRRGEVSAEELVRAAIERIEKLDPQLNAVIHRHFDRALAEVRTGLPDGPFRGVPFLLKDLGAGHVAGDPCHWGTRFLRDANYRAATTAYLVERFRAAGLVVVGRTNVPELGAWATTEPEAYGPTRNPWNPAHSSGGSSGGAAAATAAGLVPMAHASDGGGSIRNPASQCGLVGLKPTRGRISLGPDSGEQWAGLVSELAVTRSVRDTAALLDAVHGPRPGDPYTCIPPRRPYRDEVGAPTGRLRVGVVEGLADMGVASECAAATAEAAHLLADLGHRVEAAWPPELLSGELTPHVVTIVTAHQARDVDRFSRLLGRELGPGDMDCDNWAITERGRGVDARQYLEAVEALHRFQRAMAAWWEGGFDLLVTPTITTPPPRLGELVPDPAEPLRGWMLTGLLLRFTAPFNATGQPAISLPLHSSAAGLPIGIQLAAAFGREDLLIRVASQLEEARPWAGRQPRIHA